MRRAAGRFLSHFIRFCKFGSGKYGWIGIRRRGVFLRIAPKRKPEFFVKVKDGEKDVFR